jgi:RNA polymerase sigma factor (sigma-70 family)
MINKDEHILFQFKKGDEQALFTLMLHYYNDLFKYGVRFTADTELTKETINAFFLHIWDNRNKIKMVENIKPYLIVSFKRFLIQELRKQHINLPADNLTNEPAELPYENYIIAAERSATIKQTLQYAIASLPRRQKQLLQLRYYEHMSYEEIAAKTSLSVRTVYNKLHEALKKLRASSAVKNIYRNIGLLSLTTFFNL